MLHWRERERRQVRLSERSALRGIRLGVIISGVQTDTLDDSDRLESTHSYINNY